MKIYPLYLNGEFVTTDRHFPVRNPATTEVIAEMSAVDRPRLKKATLRLSFQPGLSARPPMTPP